MFQLLVDPPTALRLRELRWNAIFRCREQLEEKAPKLRRLVECAITLAEMQVAHGKHQAALMTLVRCQPYLRIWQEFICPRS